MAFQTKSSVFALIKEDTEGTLKYPTAGSDFSVLREGFSFDSTVETVDSDELVNDIGASKAFLAKETPSGSLPKYFKHSGVEGQAPDYGTALESCMGSEVIHAEETTDSGSTAGSASAKAILKVADSTGESRGQAVMIKDAVNGYSIRNIQEVTNGTDLTLNYNLDNAPAAGVLLGQAITYAPTATGHPTFSAHLYQASSNSAYHQAQAGCRTTSLSMEFTANELATLDVEFEGIEFFYNPVEIDASNLNIDFTDDGGAKQAVLSQKVYKSSEAFRAEVEAKLNAVSVNSITASFANDGKFTLASDGAVFELDWATGLNQANDELGFNAVDLTGATSYESDNERSYDPEFTPSFDDQQPNIVRSNELIMGDFNKFSCRAGSTVSFSIATPKTDLDDFCSESGTSESLTLEREVTFSTTLYLTKHDADDFNAFISNGDSSLMFNHGEKDSAGNWKPGTCVNIYLPKMSFTAHTITDADGIQVIEVEGKGFVTSSEKDCYINLL